MCSYAEQPLLERSVVATSDLPVRHIEDRHGENLMNIKRHARGPFHSLVD